MDINYQKTRARIQAKSRRQEVASDPYYSSQAAVELIKNFPAAKFKRKIIAGIWPLPLEIDTRPLLKALSDTGFQLALPQTPRSGKPLRFKNWQWNDHLKAGPYGTREPESHKADITPQVVLVPMLAFCRDGRRLGYGGGYYDRSLAELRASDANVFACGIGFAAQEAAHIPTDGYDQMLDAMLTEREFYAFKY